MCAKYVGNELSLFAAATRWKRYFASHLASYLGQKVLEVGAGIGGTTALLHNDQRTWVCLEPDHCLAQAISDRISQGELPATCSVAAGDLTSLSPDDRFDTLLYIDVLEHIEHDRAELVRAASYLQPGGHLVVLAPAHAMLFTEFDQAIGHFRRYTLRTLRQITPPGTKIVCQRYLDSVGMLASLANRLLLRQSMPTPAQIRFWDGFLVPCSRCVDPLLFYRVGKSVITVWRKFDCPPRCV